MSTDSSPAKTRTGGRNPVAILTSKRVPLFAATFIPEPALEFGDHQQLADPRVGLGIHGPFDRHEARHTPIRLGLIGTGPLIDKTRQWIAKCQSSVPAIRRITRKGSTLEVPTDPAAVPTFPGMRAVFDADFVLNPQHIVTLSARELNEIDSVELYEPRVTRLAQLLGNQLAVLADKGSPPDVVLVALPYEIRKRCTTPSNHRRRGKVPLSLGALLRASVAKDNAMGQLSLLDVAAAHNVNVDEDDRESVVLHSALKIHGMHAGLPTQLLWEGTLDGVGVEDDATIAWNVWSGIYYKARNELWRLTGLAANACFVGISFYKDRSDERLRSCVAQAFSDRGEGLVLRSEPFAWKNEMEKTPHLERRMASEMLTRVLKAYRDHLHVQPSRVVIHKWQRYWPEERAGFEDALEMMGVHSHDFVAFGSRGLRFFRAGQEPVVRGTYISLGPAEGLLFTRGYVPFLRRYPGMRVPRPLEIIEHHGSGSMIEIAREILALTKLDWNTTMFAGKEPITTAFAEDVGRILSELPHTVQAKPSYRFYM
jgi:hypothetical protein